MVGSVKTFDPAKGYGFISAPNFPVDIYFKPELEPVAVGQQVTFTIHWTPQGKPQAREVTSPMQAGEMLYGTVRRYNPNKGFGFLAVEGRSQDVYFQKKDLPAEHQESSGLDGAQFQFSVTISSANKPQAQDMELLSMPAPGSGGGCGVKRPAPMQVPVRPSQGPPAASPVVVSPMKRLRPTPTTQPTVVPPPMAFAPRPALGGMQLGVQQMMAAVGLSPTLGPAGANGKTPGTVKSFNPMKGFGFIAAPSLPSDVYFNAKSLPDEYRQVDLTGQQVSFNVRYTADGKIQGTDVQVGF
ncbi:ACL5 [Symbiodinium natans]|uniref:ACL5 protein n=1 Tax=Symbiodinium natans TaxID=878477 RepID=A0A812MYK6_9DINO|nr:ACL5 [Symbiodinium natans]